MPIRKNDGLYYGLLYSRGKRGQCVGGKTLAPSVGSKRAPVDWVAPYFV